MFFDKTSLLQTKYDAALEQLNASLPSTDSLLCGTGFFFPLKTAHCSGQQHQYKSKLKEYTWRLNNELFSHSHLIHCCCKILIIVAFMVLK